MAPGLRASCPASAAAAAPCGAPLACLSSEGGPGALLRASTLRAWAEELPGHLRTPSALCSCAASPNSQRSAHPSVVSAHCQEPCATAAALVPVPVRRPSGGVPSLYPSRVSPVLSGAGPSTECLPSGGVPPCALPGKAGSPSPGPCGPRTPRSPLLGSSSLGSGIELHCSSL